MPKSKHTEAQMIAAIKQLEAGRKAEDVAREVGVRNGYVESFNGKLREPWGSPKSVHLWSSEKRPL